MACSLILLSCLLIYETHWKKVMISQVLKQWS